jgi:hypothetical protein
MSSLEAAQAAALGAREALMRELGLDAATKSFEKVSAVAKAALKRGAAKRKADREKEPAVPMRRSSR